MNGEQLTKFRDMVGLSQQAMADVLGYSRRQYQLMETDKQTARPAIGLACAAYALGIREYDGPAVKAIWDRRMKETKRT